MKALLPIQFFRKKASFACFISFSHTLGICRFHSLTPQPDQIEHWEGLRNCSQTAEECISKILAVGPLRPPGQRNKAPLRSPQACPPPGIKTWRRTVPGAPAWAQPLCPEALGVAGRPICGAGALSPRRPLPSSSGHHTKRHPKRQPLSREALD